MEDPHLVAGILRVEQWDSELAESFYMMEDDAMEPFAP
jgi:hypothetical protein